MGAARNQSSSLRRALDVLAEIAAACERDTSPTLTEIATRTGLNRSTVSRLLQPLIDARLIDQEQASGRYRLGPQTARLGQVYLEHFSVHDLAEPVLRSLVEESQETAHLGIRDGLDVVYVHKVESPLSVRTVSRIGSRQPLYSTAMGKTLLAHSDPSVMEAVMEHGMASRTEYTITDPEALADALRQVRSDGFAIDDQENECEIRCVGAPVFDHRGEVIAAISISGPATRMSVERLRLLGGRVVDAAEEISRRLAAPEAVLSAARR